jgi:hypothetical protein
LYSANRNGGPKEEGAGSMGTIFEKPPEKEKRR